MNVEIKQKSEKYLSLCKTIADAAEEILNDYDSYKYFIAMTSNQYIDEVESVKKSLEDIKNTMYYQQDEVRYAIKKLCEVKK